MKCMNGLKTSIIEAGLMAFYCACPKPHACEACAGNIHNERTRYNAVRTLIRLPAL